MTQLVNTSPLQLANRSTQQIMLIVALATMPGILIHIWFFGYGILLNIAVAFIAGTFTEALCLRLRSQSAMEGLRDNSTLVTAVLFGIAVPPGSSWWLLVAGMVFAIALVKHAYGGLGQNTFNPAMGGYLFLLLAFPLQMTAWHLPSAALNPEDGLSPLGWSALLESLQFLLSTSSTQYESIDGFAKATPLIEFKMATQSAISNAAETGLSVFDRNAETGWELMNVGYLLGGLILLGLRIISWHIPAAVILSVLAMSMLFYSSGGASVVGTPYLHLFSGATLLAAFFIATDPVSACTSNPAKLVYGIIIGCSIYGIRVWGSYLDSIAIAVLFGNFCAPLLDHLLRPRIFGHPRFSNPSASVSMRDE